MGECGVTMIRKRLGKVKKESEKRRLRRKLSIRKKLEGTTERPRVSFFRSNKHISLQVIDDTEGRTLVSVQTYGKNAVKASNNVDGGKIVGTKLAESLKEKGLTKVVFDRNGYKFHGVVASVVEAARENGIQI